MTAARCTMYKTEIIEAVRQRLRNLPAPKHEEVSKLDVVKALAGEIDDLQKLGHSIKAIAATISEVGVPLTMATLKTYLGKVKPTGRRTRRQRLRRPSRVPASNVKEAGGVTTRDATGNPAEVAASLLPQTTTEPWEELADDGKVKLSGAPAGDRSEQPTMLAGDAGERVNETARQTTAEATETSPERDAVGRPAGPAVKARRVGGESRDAATEEARIDGKENSLGTGAVPRGGMGLEAPVTDRQMVGEIDKRKSTFVPREDSRDI